MVEQLELFCDFDNGPASAGLEDNPWQLLLEGWHLAISISGGKDSQAMMQHLVEFHRTNACTGQIVAVHADLGRAEWGMSEVVVRRQAHELGIELHVIQRNDGADLVSYIKRRKDKLEGSGKPFWPSSATRYCTSDLKRAPVDVWLRNYFPTGNVLCAMGMRAEESTARSKLHALTERTNCMSKTRTVYNWLPIHQWKLPDVWRQIGYDMEQLYNIQDDVRHMIAAIGNDEAMKIIMDNFKAHPAYALGNSRLSCSLCVLADRNDLMNGAEWETDLYRLYTRWEYESGISFQKEKKEKKWLLRLRPDLLDNDVYDWAISNGLLTQEG